ncbi:hypothetical protein L249_3543 [Ophiocordyceps polyrhachis-furcata BCC 54312]|uniref:Stress-response A/B barrel domain-containing protein n=1 Tax=Ophiocordyceps polyrhachis-furcata BCC 54312 TaxID=1330021 RepID=A0A367LMM2_9HYPO|nr:hypothetical protein L249_3543 [Ophiocordyceps polyrhachis-furcata BCC 54312]
MTVYHVVIFRFREGASPESIKQTCSEVMALKDRCLHPTTGRPYVVSLTGGRDMSMEGLHNDFSHVFVFQFDCVADRDFYVESDTAHRAFVEAHVSGSSAAVEKAMVVDFQPGHFSG